ncbi:MAG: hypothetical protein ACLRSW_06450 [Christensenellaceae bacterium]
MRARRADVEANAHRPLAQCFRSRSLCRSMKIADRGYIRLVGIQPISFPPQPEYAHQEIQYEYDEALIRLDGSAPLRR